jgi:tripartite-type tricarboxylate transporter receptor subunit TctC
MRPPLPSRAAVLTCAFGVVWGCASAQADAVEDFYRGKTVTLVASGGAGGPIDLAARQVAKYLPRYIPGNPVVVVRNMPGGGHVLASNFLFTNAPKDGTYIGGVVNSVPIHQVIDGRGVRYDASKFLWLGSTGNANLMTVAWHTSGFNSIDEVFKRDLITGATGVGSGTYVYTNAMNIILGTKFKMVLGYASSAEVDLAIERGEVQARGGFSLTGIKQERPHWLAEKKVNVLLQVGAEREAEYPDVPLMHELARTEEQRQILTLISSPALLGRPFFTPPDIPADRFAALRKAFTAVVKDEEFIADGRRLNLDLNPISGEKIAEIVNDTVNAPPDVIAKAKAALETSTGAN